MGKQALVSHSKGKKHQCAEANMKKCLPIGVFYKQECSEEKVNSDIPVTKTHGTMNSSSSVFESLSNTNTEASRPRSITLCNPDIMGAQTKPQALKSYLLVDSVTKAEVLWCLQTVMQHASFRSAANCIQNFAIMFPDSDIARKMQMQRTKVAYTIVHGLAPYFSTELQDLLNVCEHIVVGFDESLNKVSQKQQMDIVFRFWCSEKSEVLSRYYTSVFLGHTCAVDLLHAFKDALTHTSLKKLVQVSMDGPNVNRKFLRDLSEDLMESSDSPVLLDIGSCGLHTLHGAFKTAICKTEWRIVEYLRAIYNLFKDVPARRADYTHYTGSETFPLKFCSIRWVENDKVAARAISILPKIVQYVKCVMSDKSKTPKSKSFLLVLECVKDKLLAPKLVFFHSIATRIEPYLKEFQTDAPLAPFLYSELVDLIKLFMGQFIKSDILEKATSISQIDYMKEENMILPKQIDLGFATKDALKKVKGVTYLEIMKMRNECRECLKKFVAKMMDRSPLTYKLTKAITCLDPAVISNSLAVSEKRLSTCLEILVEKNWLAGMTADKVCTEFKQLCAIPGVMHELKAFRRKKERLDHFWVNLIESSGDAYNELLSFVKFVCILSHGNASLERGFSINAECLVENLKEESLIAQRQVFDAVAVAGGINNIEITKKLIHSSRNAHSRYVEARKRQRKEEVAKIEAENEKKRRSTEKKELESKKMRLMAEARKEAALIDDKIQLLSK